MAPAPAPAPAPASAAKKGKAKKEPDPSESRKLLEAKIAQLEQDQAGDKEQELEIGASPPAVGVRYCKGVCIRLWWLRKHMRRMLSSLQMSTRCRDPASIVPII